MGNKIFLVKVKMAVSTVNTQVTSLFHPPAAYRLAVMSHSLAPRDEPNPLDADDDSRKLISLTGAP